MAELYVWNGERNYVDPDGFRTELESFRQRCDDVAMIDFTGFNGPAGFAYAEDMRSTRTSASVGMYVIRESRGSFVGPVAFSLFAWHLFFAHSKSKINLAVAGWNHPMLKLAHKTKYLRVEGVQKDELILDGRSFDYHLFTLTRDSFELARRARFWRRFIDEGND